MPQIDLTAEEISLLVSHMTARLDDYAHEIRHIERKSGGMRMGARQQHAALTKLLIKLKPSIQAGCIDLMDGSTITATE